MNKVPNKKKFNFLHRFIISSLLSLCNINMTYKILLFLEHFQ